MIGLKEVAKNMALYYHDPVAFSYDIIGSRHTDYQQKVLYGISDNKKVAWRSSHGLGKTYTAADVLLWFLFTRPNSRVITTASLWRQVGILWNEAGGKIQKMRFDKLLIDRNKIDINLGIIRITPNWFAKGMASDDPEKLEGQHAEDILFIVDEAKLVSHKTFKSISGALTSTGAKLLVISTPSENNEGYFYDIWKDGLDFVKYHTSAFDSPNIKHGKIIVPHLVTQEWVDECENDWGKDSPTYITKVLGDFPDITEDTLIPYKWVEQAIDRSLEKTTPIEVSCDVARYGSDVTVIMQRHGPVARVSSRMAKRDTMEVAGAVKFLYNNLKATKAKIDVIGIGSGVCDRLREQRIGVMDCNNAEKAIDSENFLNARAENYWHLRTLFKEGNIDIENNKFLVQELTSLKYKYHSSGRIMVESKEDIRKRIGRSPDYADALSYLFAPKRYGEASQFNSIKKEQIASSW
jgi:phage terminase large subunit